MGGVGSSGVGIGYVRPVQFLDHLTVIIKNSHYCQSIDLGHMSKGGG